MYQFSGMDSYQTLRIKTLVAARCSDDLVEDNTSCGALRAICLILNVLFGHQKTTMRRRIMNSTPGQVSISTVQLFSPGKGAMHQIKRYYQRETEMIALVLQ